MDDHYRADEWTMFERWITLDAKELWLHDAFWDAWSWEHVLSFARTNELYTEISEVHVPTHQDLTLEIRLPLPELPPHHKTESLLVIESMQRQIRETHWGLSHIPIVLPAYARLPHATHEVIIRMGARRCAIAAWRIIPAEI